MYEVKMKFVHGWANVWDDTDEQGVVTPVVFETREEAINEVLDVILYSQGAFNLDDFKVEEV
jgi:hypothetical protein